MEEDRATTGAWIALPVGEQTPECKRYEITASKLSHHESIRLELKK